MGNILSLIGTGVALGVVHVLTGPDHLSALATLSANVGSWHAFFLGIRWGVGHSTGLLCVAILFLLISRESDADKIEMPVRVSRCFESLVGLFMLLLGAYGIRRAWEKRYKDFTYVSAVALTETQTPEVEVDAGQSYHDHVHFSDLENIASLRQSGVNPPTASQVAGGDHTEQMGQESAEDGRGWFGQLSSRISTRTMAIFAGIIHGLAGPGGVLGVIPAVEMRNGRLAAVYLGFFCLSSTLTMGIFAVLYGTCSSMIGGGTQREFIIECASSCLSILVGITWLVLLSMGKLEAVFP